MQASPSPLLKYINVMIAKHHSSQWFLYKAPLLLAPFLCRDIIYADKAHCTWALVLPARQISLVIGSGSVPYVIYNYSSVVGVSISKELIMNGNIVLLLY